jgi:plasmid stabilization system protein ParE
MSRSLGNRSKTIDVVIAGSGVARSAKVKQQLEREWKALGDSSRIGRPRREFLQVIHTSRLLDSFLAAFLRHYSVQFPQPRSIGSYLKGLRDHSRPTIGNLPEHRRKHHQVNVVNVRNVFMHEAGAFPTKKQADELMSSMHVCILEIAALE